MTTILSLNQPLQVLPPPVAVPRAVCCLGLVALHAPVLESLPPPSRERSKSPDVDEPSGIPDDTCSSAQRPIP
jgi:hypothetical protein